MYLGLKNLHSLMPYVLLTILLLAIITSIISYYKKKPHTEADNKNGLIVMIVAHLQLVVGLILYFVSPKGAGSLSQITEAMEDPIRRLYALEHPVCMLLAIVFITAGHLKAKKGAPSHQKHKVKSIYFLVALFFILIKIPWSVWP